MNAEDIVFLVSHVKSDSNCLDDYRVIGVFSSEGDAEKAIAELKGDPGFSNYPNGFSMDRMLLNTNYWEGGFVVG